MNRCIAHLNTNEGIATCGICGPTLERERYNAVYGAMVARLSVYFTEDGERVAPDEEDMRRAVKWGHEIAALSEKVQP